MSNEYIYNVIRIIPASYYTVETALKVYLEAIKENADHRPALGELRRTIEKATHAEVASFTNQEAADAYEALTGNWYPEDPIMVVKTELLETFVQYRCSECGSTKFQITWSEEKRAIVEYDPSDDDFGVRDDYTDDYRNIEVTCKPCGSRVLDDPGDLEERIWDALESY